MNVTKSTKITLGLVTGAFLLGGGVGTALGGSSPAPATAPTSARTSAAAVQPAPTVTVTAAPVASVPRACRAALTAADVVNGIAGKGFGVAAQYPPLIPRAFKAGLDQDLSAARGVTAEIKDLNGQMPTGLPEAMDNYRTLAAQCRDAK